MLALPRSALLAAWGSAALRGETPIERAVSALTGSDEPHEVADPDGVAQLPGRPIVDLASLLSALAARQVPGLRLALPVPGDVRGLPGPASFNRAALDAGEAAVALPAQPGRGSLDLAVIPQVQEFGSPWEPGAYVTWLVHRVDARPYVDVEDVAEADRALREALLEATQALTRLDLAGRPGGADRISSIRAATLPAGALPLSTPHRCASVLTTAARLRAILALAERDDGGALTAGDAEGRARALRNLDGVCRRAIVAALSA